MELWREDLLDQLNTYDIPPHIDTTTVKDLISHSGILSAVSAYLRLTANGAYPIKPRKE